MNPEYITFSDWEERYGAVRQTFYRWKRKYGFPAPVRVGRRRYFRMEDLREWEARFSDRFGARDEAAAC